MGHHRHKQDFRVCADLPIHGLTKVKIFPNTPHIAVKLRLDLLLEGAWLMT